MTTVLQWITALEKDYSSNIAFRYVKENAVREISYTEFVTDIKRFASRLRIDFQKCEGVHFGILARNSYSYAVCLFGIMLVKGVAIPLNIGESLETIRDQINHADITCLFTDGEFENREHELLSAYVSNCKIMGMENYKECTDAYDFFDDFDMERLALIIFTSGTTGKSKAVALSYKNLFSAVKGYESILPMFDMEFRAFCVVPFYHISGVALLLMSSACGFCMNLCNDLKYMFRDMQLMRSTFSLVVPVILKSWAKEVKRGNADKLGSLKVILCGAADVDAETLNAFAECGILVIHVYALSEIAGVGTVNASGNPSKIKSVGFPVAGCELKIIDGEVCLKSEAVFCGYYMEPEETAKTLIDGWLHTGDLGYMDAEGYLYLTGRKKECIILASGENVNPEELEELLERNPYVIEALVEGREEKICANVVCKPDAEEQVRKDIMELNRNLPLYKRITLVECRTEPLERTGTGKKKRR